MFKSVRHSPHQFGLPEAKVPPFEKILMQFEAQLLDGFIFQVLVPCLLTLAGLSDYKLIHNISAVLFCYLY